MADVSKTFDSCEMLLPDFSKIDGTKWATIACDQFTSEPEYWQKVAAFVGDAPSTFRMILPEVYLSEREERIPVINRTMEQALASYLSPIKGAMIALERRQSDGKVRRGLVGAIDLEAYDFRKGAKSLIRATEGTVTERIPPRVEIRKNAPLEIPHVLLLIDDPEKTVIEPVLASAKGRKPLYDFPLMLDGGRVTGRLLTKGEQAKVQASLATLADLDTQKQKYGNSVSAPLLFAVGDGNHSLAAAKTTYELLKAEIGLKAAKVHPARYALCEIENLHDDALAFEPIYRVIFGCDPEKLLADFVSYTETLAGNASAQKITAVWDRGTKELVIEHPKFQLPVGTLRAFIDDYCKIHPELSVDFIHEKDSLLSLTKKENAIGFLFEGIKKEDLFRGVIFDGALPRKTFSMGHARDKRYYLECRKIK